MTSTRGRMAERKDLHEGRSLWADSPRTGVRTSTLRHDETCEIVIVGGGISGALSALMLAQDGFDVIVLDRRTPGTGSTVASTAMIQFEIDTPLTELTKKIGKKNASRAYLRSLKAVEDLGELIQTHDMNSGWIPRQALYLAGNTLGSRGLQTETAARQAIGLPSNYLTSAELADTFGIDRTGAILSDGAAELDPAQTSAACLRVAMTLGARVHAGIEVRGVIKDTGGLRVLTADGPSVTCKKLIFATGYEVVKGVPRSAFDIISSWAIATKPLDPQTFWPNQCLIWEASDPYLYMRTTKDNRILAGGEDSGLLDPKRRASAIPNKSAALLRKIKRLLNRQDLEIDYAWAGAFAESPTGLPCIMPMPDLPGALAILGCGGNGITFSVIAGQIAASWASGKRDPDADLFEP